METDDIDDSSLPADLRC